MALGLVIWDYNGTLTNDLSRFTTAINIFLREYFVPPATEEEVACYNGDILGFYSQRGVPSPISEIGKRIFEIYETLSEPLNLNSGVIETLEKISRPQVLVTRHPTYLIEREVDQLGLRNYFTHILSGVQDKAALFQQLCAERRILPSEVVSVGDMVGDILAGKRAGIKTIAVPGYHPRHILEPHRPDYLVDSFPEVYKCIQNHF